MRCKWSRGRIKVANTRFTHCIQNQLDIYEPYSDDYENKEAMHAQIQIVERFVIATAQKGPLGLAEEYRNIPAFPDPTAKFTAFTANMRKNRYSDVHCIDSTRVVLKIDSERSGDYIHANYVQNELLNRKFICTQGPLQDTTYDFWRMVYQEKINSIVMLCSPNEEGRTKCDEYWPEGKGNKNEYSSLIVENVGQDDDDFKTTQLIISPNPAFDWSKEDKAKTKHQFVHLYRWSRWPDRGIPDKESVMIPLRLLDLIKSGPSVIHCSAGIGRTGSLMVIEIALKTIMSGQELNIRQITEDLRKSRCQCVQNEMQYLYVHRILIEYAIQYMNTEKTKKGKEACFRFLEDYNSRLGKK
ncbi:unnamed protein product [Auanema sp. JU1783]|nr:unnamed protein product [Auanema sp. JU1783]